MYSIGDVEALTGVKAHILRYWETIVPGIAPQKDFGGRRLYSQSELEKIYRLKIFILLNWVVLSLIQSFLLCAGELNFVLLKMLILTDR